MTKLVGKENINLGRTPETKFKESKSITALKYLLEKNNNIKVRANEEDTIPNLDGSVMILDDNNMDRITVDIQSKTLPETYNNIYPYKYECDTKVFNVVLENVTFNPVVLMLVDINKEKVYWKHISRQYAKSLNLSPDQQRKTITFSDEDLFNIDIFRNTMDEASCELETIIDEGIKSIVTSNVEENNPFYAEMQEEIDRINNLFDNDFKTIKDFLFPNVWKFGIAYNKYSDGSSFLGIYKINKGKNGKLVKNFDFKSDEYMMSRYTKLESKSYIKDSLKSWLNKVMNSYFNLCNIPSKYLSDMVLREIIFQFLDRLSYDLKYLSLKENRGVYYKNEEDIEKVIQYILGLKSFYYQLVVNKDKKYPMLKAITPYFNATKKFLVFNPLIQPNEEEYELLLQCLNNPKPFPNTVFLAGSQDVDFELLEDAVLELKKRNITIVKRVWNNQKWEEFMKIRKESGKSVFELSKARGYLDKDLYINLDKLFSNLKECLDYSYSNMLNGDKYKLMGEYYLLYDKTVPYKYNLFIKKSNKFIFDFCNTDLEEKTKQLETKKYYDSCINGSIDNIFALDLPLYTYVKLLINKGIARTLGFDIKFDRELHRSYTIESIPIINDIK